VVKNKAKQLSDFIKECLTDVKVIISIISIVISIAISIASFVNLPKDFTALNKRYWKLKSRLDNVESNMRHFHGSSYIEWKDSSIE